MAGIPGVLICMFGFSQFMRFFTKPSYTPVGAGLSFWALFAVLFGLSVTGLFVAFICYEVFRYTHFPIRFNRGNRMVYVFRTNGTVLSAPWDDIFFTLEFSGPAKLGNIQGHILDKRSQRVQETFAFSAVSTSKEILLGH